MESRAPGNRNFWRRFLGVLGSLLSISFFPPFIDVYVDLVGLSCYFIVRDDRA